MDSSNRTGRHVVWTWWTFLCSKLSRQETCCGSSLYHLILLARQTLCGWRKAWPWRRAWTFWRSIMLASKEKTLVRSSGKIRSKAEAKLAKRKALLRWCGQLSVSGMKGKWRRASGGKRNSDQQAYSEKKKKTNRKKENIGFCDLKKKRTNQVNSKGKGEEERKPVSVSLMSSGTRTNWGMDRQLRWWL